jgi:hypothetical protein
MGIPDGTPFRFDGPVSPDLLIDRDEELSKLARRAGDRVSVRLVAPRRYGKTSLLLAHAAQLRETGWRAAHVDFSRVTDVTDVARRIAAAYAPLDASWTRAHLAPLLGRLGLAVGPSGPSVSLGPRPSAPRPEVAEDALYRLFDLPLTLWERDRIPTLVVLDEFQDLLVARKDLDGLLRSRIQYHGDAAAYVFAGSEPSMMRELFDARERPLFGQADPISLDPLPLDVTQVELAARFTAEGLDAGDALAPLVGLCAGHPQRTMLCAYLLAERLQDGERPTPATASAALEDALARTDAAHGALWGQLDGPERVVLAALADGGTPTSRRLADEHRLARRTLALAARRLADRGHVHRVGSATAVTDPLLAEWLRRR